MAEKKTADRILDFVPPELASWWGGATKPRRLPREVFVYSKVGGRKRKVPLGAYVGLRGGIPIIRRKM